MQQRFFDFDRVIQEQADHVAEATSLPPPLENKLPPLVRPDRQIAFDGASHYEWPAAKHDRDTITVDRIREDIDGPSHRFVICRGDTVEVFFSHEKTDIGKVVGISHANEQVCVRFPGGKNGVWLAKSQIYPAIETSSRRPKNGQRLSEVIAEVNDKHGRGLTEADRVTPPKAAPTSKAILHFLARHAGQEFSIRDLRHEFGCVDFDPASPLTNPVHKALRSLRDAGQVHAIEPRFGEPRFSILRLPNAAEDLTLAHCPHSMLGPEIQRLSRKHRHTIADFAKQCGFTQKHVREVFDRGLDNQNAVRDWLEAILPRKAVVHQPVTSLAATEPLASTPYTFDDFWQVHRALVAGALPYSEYQSSFVRLLASEDAIVSELKTRFQAPKLVSIAKRLGCWDANRSTKDENAAHIYRKMTASFLLDGTVSYSMGERYEDAVIKKVQAVTPKEYEAALERWEIAAAEEKKSLSNPETFLEFRTFLHSKSEAHLTDEQLCRYDALHATMTRDRRAAARPTTVAAFQSEELSGYAFQIKQGYHDKRQCPVWIVSLSTRVEPATFDELNRKAKMLGGWFSSFKKSDAGFQFLSEDNANRFAALLSGDVDRSEVLAERKERKELTAAERLHELADSLAARAEETIAQSENSLQNTVRRADIQAGVRGRAFAEAALSRTMHSIAEALSRNEANYLDGIRHITHIETLDTLLRLSRWARIREVRREESESHYAHGRRVEQIEGEPISFADIRFVEYPYPWIHKRLLDELVHQCRSKNGVKQSADRMRKRLAREKDDFVTFRADHDIESLEDFLSRAKGAGLDVERVDGALQKYRRLQRAGITDIHELRSGLREYLHYRAEARGDDPVKIAERELIGKRLPGFFPTPKPVIERMLEIAKIESHHRVLEPSCGKADIVDAIVSQHPGIDLHAIEVNRTLSDVLSAKGYEVEFGDFVEHRSRYDRIVMNPPFENGQDIEHIRHAYELLSPGGCLVSVMSEGPFFRSDKKSSEFREWLEEVGAEVEQLPDDAFTGAEAFRETSVRTRLVTIVKEGCA